MSELFGALENRLQSSFQCIRYGLSSQPDQNLADPRDLVPRWFLPGASKPAARSTRSQWLEQLFSEPTVHNRNATAEYMTQHMNKYGMLTGQGAPAEAPKVTQDQVTTEAVSAKNRDSTVHLMISE